MKFKSLLLTTAIAGIIVSTSAFAANAKFAAHVSEAGAGLHLLHNGAVATVSGTRVDAPDKVDDLLKATLKVANKKDLLIGVSLQSGLYTDTQVKGKNGSSEQALAEAGIKVKVIIDGGATQVYPSEVVFASRIQELTATLGGVIESCEVAVDPETGLGDIIIAEDCVVSDEAIGLMLNTTSANHFNFVAPDLTSGEHEIVVQVTALSSAEFLNGTYSVDDYPDQGACEFDGGVWNGTDSTCTFTTTDNAASSWALVDIGTLTVEEVRATNQEGGIVIDTDVNAP
jgi:hypothetical protein